VRQCVNIEQSQCGPFYQQRVAVSEKPADRCVLRGGGGVQLPKTRKKTMKTEDEVQEMADKAAAAQPKYHGMTYEEGVRAALDWVLENMDEGDTPL